MMEKATVYFTKDISPAGLQKAYDAMSVSLKGNDCWTNYLGYRDGINAGGGAAKGSPRWLLL